MKSAEPVDFLSLHGVPPSATTVIEAGKLLARVSDFIGDGTYENERKYYAFLNSEEGTEEILGAFDRIEARYKKVIARQKPFYAADYADRVFHDRQLCEYLAELVVTIGFDGDDDDSETPKRWVARECWPIWVLTMLRSRDRGDCAKCGLQLVKECNQRRSQSENRISKTAA